MKEKSKKRKFKVPYAKKEEQKYSDQIPHRREFPSQAEMVDATGQKTSMRDSSVLTRDEQKSSAHKPIANTIPTSIIIKNTKVSKRSNTWRTGRLSRNRIKDLKGICAFHLVLNFDVLVLS